ncbi:50S ribosomal protein L25 [Alkaliphilus transvaalensis]|uniref:50S ribosomal protein L25 n=1 Tax=Alkaliphilus transvaalensis TaxID=114628 RepID=UPI00047899CF|nr:50S ribosomal protein L25 [Alkaliphilus transvaalensis]
MATPLLEIYERETVGKNCVAKERRQGKVPAIVYSKGNETKLVFLPEREFEKILSKYGSSTRLALNLEGNKTFAVIKEIQRDTLKHNLLHVDLQTLNENQKIKLTLPIHLINKESVESNSEIIQSHYNEIDINTYPKYIPDRIEADAKLLKSKSSITVGDLNIAKNDNIELGLDLSTAIANLVYVGKKEEPLEEEI